MRRSLSVRQLPDPFRNRRQLPDPFRRRGPGMGDVSDGVALALVAGFFIGVPFLLSLLARRSS